jgi:hypothetical protein
MRGFPWNLLLVGISLAANGADAQLPRATLPAGARVELRLETPIDTRRTRTGDALRFIVVGSDCTDRQRLRAGPEVVGRVVHAQKAGMFGKAAELLITTGPWTPDGATASVRFRNPEALAGKSRDGTTIGVAVVAGPFAAFVRGGNVVVPAGTPMSAEVREAIALPETAFMACTTESQDAIPLPVDPPVPHEPTQGELHETRDVRPVDSGREPEPEPDAGAGAAVDRNSGR